MWKGAVHFPPWWMEALEKQLRFHWSSGLLPVFLIATLGSPSPNWTAPDIMKRCCSPTGVEFTGVKYSLLALTLGWLASPTLCLPMSFFHGCVGSSCTFGTPTRGPFLPVFLSVASVGLQSLSWGMGPGLLLSRADHCSQGGYIR